MADTRDADADEAYENDFSLGDNWVPTRFLLLELMGTYFYTLISAGIVISSGIFTYQFTTNEMNPSRHIAIALANAFVRHAIRVAGRGGGGHTGCGRVEACARSLSPCALARGFMPACQRVSECYVCLFGRACESMCIAYVTAAVAIDEQPHNEMSRGVQ